MSSEATELDQAPGTDDQGQADGSPPAPDPTSAVAEATVPESQFKELQRTFTERSEKLKAHEEAFALMRQHGWTMAQLETYVSGGDPNQSEPQTSKVDAIIGKFEDPATQGVLKELTDAIREELQGEYESRLTPLSRSIQQTQSEVASERAALAEGLTLPELRSSEYANFVAEYEAERPYLASVKRTHPEAISKEIARAFKESRAGFGKERQRLQDAKDNSLASTSSSGTVTDQAKNGAVKVKRGSTSMLKIQQLLREGKKVEWT